MRILIAGAVALAALGQAPAPTPAPVARQVSPSLAKIKRIYVGTLTGGATADALRELIITSLDSTHLFVLTENPDKADATLKGAAEDESFDDLFDSSTGVNARTGTGAYNKTSSKTLGGLLGNAVGDNDSHHIKEHKHQAYATVRLVSADGDVLWSTTQESGGGKFRGASNEVAARVAHQLALDFDLACRQSLK